MLWGERSREKGRAFFYSRMTGNKDRRNYKIEKITFL